MEIFKKVAIICIVLSFSLTAFGVPRTSNGTGGGLWTDPTTWNPAGTPTSADDLTILAGDIVTNTSGTSVCFDLTVNGTLSCASPMFLKIHGDYILGATGSESGNSGTIAFYPGVAGIISSAVVLNSRVVYIFYKGTTINAGTTITKTSSTVSISTNCIVTNQGTVTFGTVYSSNGCGWINAAGASLTLTTPGFLAGGATGTTLTAHAVPNTVHYNITSAGETIKNPVAGYYNLTLSGGAGKSLGNDLTVLNHLTINTGCPFSSSNRTINLGGDWLNSGSFTQGTGTVNFNGTGAQNIGGSSVTTFYNLTKSGTGTTTFLRNVPVTNLVTISDGILNTSTFGLTGTAGLTQTNGELQLAKLSVTLPELSGAYAISGGKVTFNGAGSQTVRSTIYNNVDILGSGTKTAGGALDINGTLTISSTLSIANYAMSVAGNFVNNGTYGPWTTTVTFDGATTVSGTTATLFHHITISGTLTGHATSMNVRGNFANNGTYNHNNGTMVFTGTTTVSGASTTDFNNITISGTLIAHATTMNVAGNFANNGTFTHNNGAVGFNGTTTVSGTATTTFNDITISGTLTGHATSMNVIGNWSNGGTYTHNSGTVVFNGTTTVSGVSTTGFNNVTINATRTLTGHATDMNVAGNWVNNGTYTHNNGRVVFDGTSTVSGSSTTSFNGVGISGTLTGHATTMNVAGNFASNGTYTHNSGTVVFNGTTIVGGASTTTFNNITISGTLTGHATNMNLVGNWVNDGTFNNNAGTVTFNSTLGPQTLSGTSATTFEGLTIDNLAGVSISSGTYTLDGALTISNGTFNTFGNSFTMTSAAGKTAYIAEITGTGAIAGNFNIQSFIRAGAATWADIAAPVNTTFGDWVAGLPAISYDYTPGWELPTQYKYDAAADDFDPITAAGESFGPGEGIEVYLAGDFNYAAFGGSIQTTTGVPNQGDQVIAINGASNLVGNPFACSISAAAAGLGAYDIMDAGNYVAGGAEVPAGQGFWFYGGALTISESAKTSTATGNVRSTVIDDPYFTLKLSSTEKNVPFSHILKVAAASNASDGWNSEEDHLYRKTPVKEAPSLYTSVDGKDLIINKFNNSNETYTMPLTLKIGISGNYQFEVMNLQQMSEYPYIKLEDKLLNTMIDLTKKNGYSFRSNANDKSERFVVHFSKKDSQTLTSTPMVTDFMNQVEVLPSSQGNIINFNLSETTNTTITVTNLMGQTIVDAIVVDANSQSVNVSLPEGYNGMYILKIESAKGSINKKFMKK